MIDLHTHTTASDGTLSPTELVVLARDSGLSALAITDHDTCAGLPEAHQAAAQHAIRIIDGIEIEISGDQPGIFHLLGLGIRDWSTTMSAVLERLANRRTERNLAMVAAMQAAGLPATMEAIETFAGGKVVGRPHFADFLIGEGFCRSYEEAFANYLTPGKPFFVPMGGLSFETAIAAIHAAGGRGFVAHPVSLNLGKEKLEAYITNLKNQGLDGIEVWHPSVNYRQSQKLADLAARLNLLVSAGSDYHGTKRSDRRLGRSLAERRRIDDHFLEALNL